MEELIEKVEKLKEALDNTEQIQDLKIKNKEIMKEKELLENIKKYNETQDEKIKEKIINHPLFREYKHSETECNILILEINQRLKKIIGKEKGCHESN